MVPNAIISKLHLSCIRSFI